MVIRYDSPDTVATSSRVLSSVGVAVLPCDTIYGLCGIAPESETRLREIKGRGFDSPFIVLIPSIESLSEIVDQQIDSSLSSLWPGPITLVFRSKRGGTVGVRLPDSAFLRDVMQECGPIYSTSVNRSGSPPLSEIDAIVEEFGNAVDLIVDAGDLPDRPPSTVIDASGEVPRVLRRGAGRIPDWIEDGESG